MQYNSITCIFHLIMELILPVLSFHIHQAWLCQPWLVLVIFLLSQQPPHLVFDQSMRRVEYQLKCQSVFVKNQLNHFDCEIFLFQYRENARKYPPWRFCASSPSAEFRAEVVATHALLSKIAPGMLSPALSIVSMFMPCHKCIQSKLINVY